MKFLFFFVISVAFAEFHLDFMYRTSPSPEAKVPGASQSNAHQGVFSLFFPGPGMAGVVLCSDGHPVKISCESSKNHMKFISSLMHLVTVFPFSATFPARTQSSSEDFCAEIFILSVGPTKFRAARCFTRFSDLQPFVKK